MGDNHQRLVTYHQSVQLVRFLHSSNQSPELDNLNTLIQSEYLIISPPSNPHGYQTDLTDLTGCSRETFKYLGLKNQMDIFFKPIQSFFQRETLDKSLTQSVLQLLLEGHHARSLIFSNIGL